MTKYEIWLTTDHGARITNEYGLIPITKPLSFTISKVVNGIGNLMMKVPITFDTDLFFQNTDMMVQVWRKQDGGTKSIFNVYFIRELEYITSNGKLVIQLTGADMNELLRRRIVAYYKGSDTATKFTYADDMLKEILSEAIVDGVAPAVDDGTRVWNDLTIAADTSSGPILTQDIPFKKLLTLQGGGVFGTIVKASRAEGTEVFFDIVPDVVTSNSISFKFITKIGQPGMDRTDTIVFSQRNNNLKQPKLKFSYLKEENYIYGLGAGKKSNRTVVQVGDSSRYNASQWNRCEGVAESRDQGDEDGVREAARAKLDATRPIRIFQASLIDTRAIRYGRDYNVGDKVKARYAGFSFDTLIRGVVLSLNENGIETIQCKPDWEND